MAEIPIQRKQRRNVWPLVIVLLLVLAAAWYFWSQRTNAVATTSADSARVVDSAIVRNSTGAPVPKP